MNFIEKFMSKIINNRANERYTDFYEERRHLIEAQKVEIYDMKMRGLIKITPSKDTSKPVHTIVIANSYNDFIEYIQKKGIDKQCTLCICSERNITGLNLEKYEYIYATELALKNGIAAGIIEKKYKKSQIKPLCDSFGSKLYLQPRKPKKKFFKEEYENV